MQIRRTLALCGATIAFVLAVAATSLAAGTSVSVRVEGKARTLLPQTVVRTHSGSITKGGTPAGACSATGAAGALDVATHHGWSGTYSSGLGIEVTKILGETDIYSRTGSYWGIWVDNRFAQFGICDLKLHAGEQLLFAPVPAKGTVFPTAIKAPKQASTQHPFKLEVVYYTSAGKARPLAGAQLRHGRFTALTDKRGFAHVGISSAGKFKFTATKKGYIRAAPVTVRVS